MEELLEQLTVLKIDQTETKIKQEPSIPVQETNLPYFLNKTGIIFDAKLIENIDDTKTVENLNKTYEQIKDNCLDKCTHLYILTQNNHEEDDNIKPKEENRQDLLGNIDPIKSECNNTYDISLRCAVELMDQIISGSISNGVAFVSNKYRTQKNCIEATLARMAIEKYNTKRVLLINFDLNHNLYVQNEFYSNNRVLTFSIHHSSHSSSESDFDCIGVQNAKGFNINMSIDKNNVSDSEFMLAFFNVFLPIAYEFSPDLVIVPTNFGASEIISANTFAHLLNFLSCLAEGKLCLLVNADEVKDSKIFSNCVLSAIRTLLGYPIPRIDKSNEPRQEFIESLLNTISAVRPYWCCLQLLNDNDENLNLDIFIQNQKNKLQEKKAKEIENEAKNIIKNQNQSHDLCDKLEKLNLKINDVPSKRTCICSDEKMMMHANIIEPHHPERPDRIKRILETLKQRDLYQRCGVLNSRTATDDEIMLCHQKEYIDKLKTLHSKTREELIEMSRNVDSVYYNTYTFECATLAAGCVLSVVDAVCSNKYTNGVAVSRPPGHHANSNSCSGFCFFNSVGIAARYAQKNYSSIKKVLILDFDVHHGNGTQDIFKDDDSVLFISLHRYDDGNFYPVGADSNYNCVGEGKGKGYSVNIPWNQSNAGDAEYVAAFLKIVMPIAYEFAPDLVLVSAGFDAAVGDPLGRFSITPAGYAQMTKMLSTLSDSKIILALEGGYNLTSISESMASCVSILLGENCPSMSPMIAHVKAYNSIRNVISVMKTYWNTFRFDEKLPQCEFVKNFKSKKNNNNKSLEMPYILRERLRSRTKNTDTSSDSIDSAKSTPRKQNYSVDSLDSSTGSCSTPVSKSAKKKTNKEREKDGLVLPLNDATNNSSTPKPKSKQKTKAHLDINSCVPYAVVPLPFCPHLLEINTKPACEQIDAFASCAKCNESTENWTCLTCFTCLCSRYVHGHMSEHYEESKHPMVLSYSDMSIWCYVCDSYVDNELLNDIKKLACDSKFS